MYKNILIDFDGTLINTNDIVVTGLRETTKKFTGQDLSDKKLVSVLGYVTEDQMKLISEPHYREMTDFYDEFYREHQDTMVKEFPGIREMLKQLKSRGYRLAIVSAKDLEGIVHGLELYELGRFIDTIVSASDTTNSKPHPDPALKAMKILGAEASETLLLGDSPLDIQCGKAAGIKTVLAGWTIFPKDRFNECTPDFIINSPSELLDIIQF